MERVKAKNFGFVTIRQKDNEFYWLCREYNSKPEKDDHRYGQTIISGTTIDYKHAKEFSIKIENTAYVNIQRKYFQKLREIDKSTITFSGYDPDTFFESENFSNFYEVHTRIYSEESLELRSAYEDIFERYVKISKPTKDIISSGMKYQNKSLLQKIFSEEKYSLEYITSLNKRLEKLGTAYKKEIDRLDEKFHFDFDDFDENKFRVIGPIYWQEPKYIE